MTDEQIVRLNAIGVRWSTKQGVIWDMDLKNQRNIPKNSERHTVPFNYVIKYGFKLGVWFSKLHER